MSVRSTYILESTDRWTSQGQVKDQNKQGALTPWGEQGDKSGHAENLTE